MQFFLKLSFDSLLRRVKAGADPWSLDSACDTVGQPTVFPKKKANLLLLLLLLLLPTICFLSVIGRPEGASAEVESPCTHDCQSYRAVHKMKEMMGKIRVE